MAAVYYFNPDNDLSLAHGGQHYSAPPRAEMLRRDLQLLPCWLAEPGSMVLCDDPSWQEWVSAHRLAITLIGRRQLSLLPADTEFRPWGWSAAMRWRLEHWGAPPALLPTPEQLLAWRQLAHRRTTIAVHRSVCEALGEALCEAPTELHTLDAVTRYAESHPGCYVKAPWSGSGRGILRALDPHQRDFAQRAQGTLQRQHSVLCEPAYERTLDFAVEMLCHHGTALPTGYSIFTTDFHSQYSSGVVAPAEVLRGIIAAAYPAFDRVEQAVTAAIAHIVAPHYSGPVGIDMLLYSRPDGSTGINPCVEINLRHTMGQVTMAIATRHHAITAVANARGAATFSIMPANEVAHFQHPLTPIFAGTSIAAVLTTNSDCSQ